VVVVVLLPFLPALHAMHDGFPMVAWYLPFGHSLHDRTFADALKYPMAQLMHVRSRVTVGARVWRSPATHMVCLLQKLRPVSAWNSSAAQEVQLT
jgi:hypothetical protein